MLEYKADLVGTTSQCPHCGQETELLLEVPSSVESGVPRRMIVWVVVAIIISVLGLLALVAGLKWAEKKTGRAGAGRPAEGVEVTSLKVERPPGASMAYAIGLVTNHLDRKRIGVKIELDLLNARSNKVWSLSCGREVIDRHDSWRFKVPVGNPDVVSAKVASVREQN
jgi:hypothetical protein